MRNRVNSNAPHQKSAYKGRGITVCNRWSSFFLFLRRYGVASRRTTLDRIRNDGHYTPNNCRWATKEEQSNNRRLCIPYTFEGKTLTLAQWARKLGISVKTLRARLNSGWSVEKTLGTELAA